MICAAGVSLPNCEGNSGNTNFADSITVYRCEEEKQKNKPGRGML